MKNIIIEFFLLFFFFSSIASIFNTIIESNYEIFNIPKGMSNFSYQMTYPDIGKESKTSPFIILKFYEPVIFCLHRNRNIEEIEEICYNEGEYYDYFSFDLISSYVFEKFQFNFSIINENENPIEMDFIDTSKEIHIPFEHFLNWNYVEVSDHNFIPEPIIFNIDQILETNIYLFKTKSKGTIVNDNNLLYYCIIDENECNFQVLTNLEVKKEKKYKFKLNPTKICDSDGFCAVAFEQIELLDNEVPEYVPGFRFYYNVNFDFNTNNIFQYTYHDEYNVPYQLIFTIDCNENFYIISTDRINSEKKYYDKNKNNNIKINLLKSRTYYFKFISVSSEIKHSCYFYVSEKTCRYIDTIDLSKNNYNNIKHFRVSNETLPQYYAVNNLKENKTVLFNYRENYYHDDNINLKNHLRFVM